MKINSYSSSVQTSSYKRNNIKNNKNNSYNPSFGNAAGKNVGRQAFEWLGEKCNILSNGSLTREMFLAVGILFMLGGRFFESRDGDEKREVVTRDVPAVALSCFGAPLLNQGLALAFTRKSGIPIVINGKKFSFKETEFTSQKQVTDWYSELKTADNPLMNLSEMVEKNGGNIKKVMKKFGFSKEMDAVTKETENSKVLEAFKQAQAKGAENFKKLEEALRNVEADNKVLKFARNSQAAVKLCGIGFMAALLGYFLPHLNIITTRKKYEGKVDQATLDMKLKRTSPVYRVSSGVLSFHRDGAKETYKNMLNMVETKN